MFRKAKTADLLWILFLVLPIVDSLNGLINNGGNNGGISLGIIYRFVVALVCVWLIVSYKLRKRVAVLLFLLAGLLAVSLMTNGRNIGLYLNYLVRLVLPMLIITAIESCVKARVVARNLTHEMFLRWRYWFPISIIIPYVLGTGFYTYENSTGYKGFYYAQNDIGYVLIMLFLFSVYELSRRMELKNVVAVILLMICNLLLGLKSNYILAVAIFVFYLIREKGDRNRVFKEIAVTAAVAVGVLFLAIVYWDKILLIVERWRYFYVRMDLLSFITSTRSERVVPAYEWILRRWGVAGVLFGSGAGYQLHAGLVEMDLFDIFFQIGVFGVVLVYGFYFRLLKRYHATGFYKWGFWISILYSTLVGHVLESALSGMFFSMLCCGSIYEHCCENVVEKQKYVQQKINCR